MQKFIPKAKIDRKIVRPENKIRQFFFDISKSTAFEIFIIGVIFLNMIQMAMVYEEATEDYLFALDVLNYIFTAVFVIEAIIKMIGLGIKSYF